MGTLKQDFQDWKKAKAEAKVCQQAKDDCKKKITTVMSFDEWKVYGDKLTTILDSLEKDKEETTQVKFAEKYDSQMQALQLKSCFINVYQIFDIDVEGIRWASVSGGFRCINNNMNGTIYETHCAGCPKFNDLVEYQLSAANTKSAIEKERVAKMMLMNHFRIFKIK